MPIAEAAESRSSSGYMTVDDDLDEADLEIIEMLNGLSLGSNSGSRMSV